jgi:HEAT repeat protein
MWKLALAVALLLIHCAANDGADSPSAQSASADQQLVLRLFLIASDIQQDVQVRSVAVDQLGTFGALAVPSLKRSLSAPCMRLKAPSEEKTFFVYHVVTALGNIGPPARETIPDLVNARNINRELDGAIDMALAAIQKPATPAAPAKAPVGEKAIDDLLKDLKSDDVTVRLVAVKVLSGKIADATTAGQVAASLVPVAQDKDFDVRRLGAQAAKKVLDIADKKAPDYDKWRQGYIDGLGKMMENKDDANERIFAARALGDLAPEIDVPKVPRSLIQASKNDPDDDVKSVAANAMKKIEKTSKKSEAKVP